MDVNRDGESPVFADERQAKIAELVSVRGRARIGELAKEFGVTEPTIRKDLRVLQSRGLLKRTHGGALALQPTVEREFAGRQATNPAAKEAIAHACVRLLQDGDSVFLDSGTTVSAVAGAIAANSSGLRLSDADDEPRRRRPAGRCSRYRLRFARRPAPAAWTARSSGALALENLQRFTFSLAFIGVSGFSDVGISVGSLAEAAVKAEAIERARRVVARARSHEGRHDRLRAHLGARRGGCRRDGQDDAGGRGALRPLRHRAARSRRLTLFARRDHGCDRCAESSISSDIFRFGLTGVTSGDNIAPTRHVLCRGRESGGAGREGRGAMRRSVRSRLASAALASRRTRPAHAESHGSWLLNRFWRPGAS